MSDWILKILSTSKDLLLDFPGGLLNLTMWEEREEHLGLLQAPLVEDRPRAQMQKKGRCTSYMYPMPCRPRPGCVRITELSMNPMAPVLSG